eukprot:3679468-Pyramimonas_sp.AAC.1
MASSSHRWRGDRTLCTLLAHYFAHYLPIMVRCLLIYEAVKAGGVAAACGAETPDGAIDPAENKRRGP